MYRDYQRAAGSSEEGSSTMLPPSPRATRPRKEAKVEAGGRQEDETKVQLDEIGKQGAKPPFSDDDIWDYNGEKRALSSLNGCFQSLGTAGGRTAQ